MPDNGNTERKIRKIKLSDGFTYTVYDANACRIDPATGKLLTGDAVIDEIILTKHLSIEKIDDMDVPTDNVLVAVNKGTTQEPEYEIKKREVSKLYEDMNGMECTIEDGILTFTRGNN